MRPKRVLLWVFYAVLFAGGLAFLIYTAATHRHDQSISIELCLLIAGSLVSMIAGGMGIESLTK